MKARARLQLVYVLSFVFVACGGESPVAEGGAGDASNDESFDASLDDAGTDAADDVAADDAIADVPEDSEQDVEGDAGTETDTEAHALEVLHGRGHLVTLCGPIRFLGGTRLPWTSIARAIAYIMRRSLWSRFRGPRYTFLSGTEPDWSALNHYLLEPAIKPIIDIVHRFDRDEVAAAMRGVTSSRSKGKRVVSIRPDEDVS